MTLNVKNTVHLSNATTHTKEKESEGSFKIQNTKMQLGLHNISQHMRLKYPPLCVPQQNHIPMS